MVGCINAGCLYDALFGVPAVQPIWLFIEELFSRATLKGKAREPDAGSNGLKLVASHLSE